MWVDEGYGMVVVVSRQPICDKVGLVKACLQR